MITDVSSSPGSRRRVKVEVSRIQTARLVMRPWSPDDAAAALAMYGDGDVAHWLAPAMARVTGTNAMEGILRQWISECSTLELPAGRWAIELAETGELVGGAAILPLPPDGVDLEIGWQLARPFWGRGLATEAGHAAAHYAFARGVDEVFAVVRPNNARGIATAQRVGMEWVGETDKYYGLTLQVYPLREGDLDVAPLAEHGSEANDA